MMLEQPVFVLSTPRSGSTLLRVMLAGHSHLFCPPELNLAQFGNMRDYEIGLGPCAHSACQSFKCDQRTGLRRAFMELQHISDEECRKMVAELVVCRESTVTIFETLMQLSAPRRLVDKSPRYTAKVETMLRTLQLFPQAQYIYLHRHPYAVIDSLLRNGFESSQEGAETNWMSGNDNIRKFLAILAPDRQITVAYETLVESPERTMREISSFLGIPFDVAMLNPYEGSRMTDGVLPGHMPPGDPNFLAHNSIDASLGSAWRGIRLPRPIGLDTRRVGTMLMYDIGN